MTSYTITDDKQIDDAREIFGGLAAMNDVLEEATGTDNVAAVAPADLYAFALGLFYGMIREATGDIIGSGTANALIDGVGATFIKAAS